MVEGIVFPICNQRCGATTAADLVTSGRNQPDTIKRTEILKSPVQLARFQQPKTLAVAPAIFSGHRIISPCSRPVSAFIIPQLFCFQFMLILSCIRVCFNISDPFCFGSGSVTHTHTHTHTQKKTILNKFKIFLEMTDFFCFV